MTNEAKTGQKVIYLLDQYLLLPMVEAHKMARQLFGYVLAQPGMNEKGSLGQRNSEVNCNTAKKQNNRINFLEWVIHGMQTEFSDSLAAFLRYLRNWLYTSPSNFLLLDPSSPNSGFKRLVTFFNVRTPAGLGRKRCKNTGNSLAI